jgi:hypothetical protein
MLKLRPRLKPKSKPRPKLRPRFRPYVGKGWVDPPPYRRKRVKFRKHVAVGCDG